jgi:molybdenum cofactor biosynthesis enzyme MoaA
MNACHVVQIELVGPRETASGAPAYMDYHLFCRTVDPLPEMTDLRLQGRGDPLLHLHLFDMVEYAVQRGVLVSLATNLTALSEQRAQQCVDSGLYRIHVTVDAADSPLATGPVHPRFLRVLRNLRRLMQARAAQHSSRPEVVLSAVLHHRDLPRLPELVRFAHQEGLQELSVEIAEDEAASMRAPLPRRVFIEARNLARALGVTLNPLHFVRDGGRAGRGRIGSISYLGETMPFNPALAVAG